MKKKKWYIIKVFSNFKYSILEYLKEYNNNVYNYYNFIDKIIIFFDIKNNNNYKFIKNCIFLKFLINKNIIKYIENIPNVLGFINKYNNIPKYLDNNYINCIIKNNNKNLINNNFININEKIIIKNKKFYNFIGIIKEINYIKYYVIVIINIYGKNIPIKLNFNDINKIK